MSQFDKLLRMNPVSTARSRGKVVVYRGTKYRAAKSAEVDVQGQLLLGATWGHGAPHYPGHVLVHDGARVTVRGRWHIMNGMRVGVSKGAHLSLGVPADASSDRTNVGSGGTNVELRLSCYNSITIGDNVILGDRVTIRDSDNHTMGDKDMSAPIVIEDDVWIGIGAYIMKGVHIGRGAVVGAGAVVTRDVPAGSLVVGIPATVKRTGINWTK
jgi:carbonic anhydrase/acetyltransferase-like protein (isoleucine patch superfamily)